MEALLSILPYIQVVLAILLTGAILVQQRGAGIGGAFGGGEGTVHYERRGSERTLFRGTILLAVIFIVSVAIPIFTDNTENIVSVPVEVPLETATDETATQDSLIKDINVVTDDGEVITIDPSTINETVEPATVPVE